MEFAYLFKNKINELKEKYNTMLIGRFFDVVLKISNKNNIMQIILEDINSSCEQNPMQAADSSNEEKEENVGPNSRKRMSILNSMRITKKSKQ